MEQISAPAVDYPQYRPNYRTLDFANFETRFLRFVDRWESGARVQCEIVHASVVDPPAYLALSYCWGDLSETTTISVDGLMVEVTSNLEQALYALQCSQSGRYLGPAVSMPPRSPPMLIWADALCINQDDLYERSIQVQRMGQIYAKATKVISWLGTYSSDQGPYHELTSVSSSLARLSKSKYIPENAICGSYEARRLAQHPYWRRVWIIQEVSKATQVEVWGAEYKCDLHTLLNYLLHEQFKYMISGTDRKVLETVQYFREKERQSHIAVARMLLSESLLRTRASLATDPRDKIYALLSLTLDGNEVVPTPSYRLKVDEVHIDLAERIIVSQGQTALMLLARQNRVSQRSWIPLWSSTSALISPWVEQCVLEERQTLDIRSRVLKNHMLEVRGDQFDWIKQVPTKALILDKNQQLGLTRTRVSNSDRTKSPADHKDSLFVVSKLCSALTFGELELDARERRHHSEPDGLRKGEFAAMAVTNLLLGVTKRRSSVMEAWFSSHKRLRIYGWSLGTWVKSHFRNAMKKRWRNSCLNSRNVRVRTRRMLELGEELDVGRELAVCERGLDLMRLHSMKVVILGMNRLAIVCDDAVVGDIICQLQNCSLPVVLRLDRRAPFALETDRYSPRDMFCFVGEVAWPKSDFYAKWNPYSAQGHFKIV